MAKQLELPLKFPTNCIIIPFEDEKRKHRDPFHQVNMAARIWSGNFSVDDVQTSIILTHQLAVLFDLEYGKYR